MKDMKEPIVISIVVFYFCCVYHIMVCAIKSGDANRFDCV